MSNTKTVKVVVAGTTYYPTPTGLKLGSRGRVMPVGEVLSMLETKGERRKLRKALRRVGHFGARCPTYR